MLFDGKSCITFLVPHVWDTEAQDFFPVTMAALLISPSAVELVLPSSCNLLFVSVIPLTCNYL